MKTPKRYKPGQLITIEGKLYRVTKRVGYTKGVCDECSFRYTIVRRHHNICWMLCVPRFPNNCYLKHVELCGNRDKQ